MTFALLAILMWWAGGPAAGQPRQDHQWLKDYQPGFEPDLHTDHFVIAIIASVLWLVLVWRVGRSMRRAVVNWAAGITLIWILAMTLWLPWLDSGKSYRNMVASMKHALPEQYSASGANVWRRTARDAALLRAILTQADSKQRCDLRLIQVTGYPKPCSTKHAGKRSGRQPQGDKASITGCIAAFHRFGRGGFETRPSVSPQHQNRLTLSLCAAE